MQRITPFLWFNDQAEEAAEFYTSIFTDGKITRTVRYSEAGPGKPGSVMVIDFELQGQPFSALNGGPHFSFTEAISFVVHCKSQEEVDYYWEKLIDGGQPSQCGWLKDRFGVSWQIVPTEMIALLSHPDPQKAQRVMQAMLQMIKLDLNILRHAADES